MSAVAPTPALEARRLEKRFGPVAALDGVSLTVGAGERVALVGESGSGKTSLLRSFNRMLDLDAGVALVGGRDVTEEDPVELRRFLGYVQQEGGLLPHWSVARNAALVPRLRGLSDADEVGRQALDLVGLDPSAFGSRWPRELSGGQRQRVALARALAARPDVVLLDEPFGALDAITRAELREMFARLTEQLSVSVLLVTHDLREAVLLCHRVAVMRAGRIEQIARAEVLVSDPASAYVEELLHKADVH